MGRNLEKNNTKNHKCKTKFQSKSIVMDTDFKNYFLNKFGVKITSLPLI